MNEMNDAVKNQIGLMLHAEGEVHGYADQIADHRANVEAGAAVKSAWEDAMADGSVSAEEAETLAGLMQRAGMDDARALLDALGRGTLSEEDVAKMDDAIDSGLKSIDASFDVTTVGALATVANARANHFFKTASEIMSAEHRAYMTAINNLKA
jgi:hypothetical protein